MSIAIVVILCLLVMAGLGTVGVQMLRHRARAKAELEQRGWTFVGKPTVAAIHGLNCPPFGLGNGRFVDDQVVGQVAGTSFQAFRYGTATYRGKEHFATMKLARSLPEFHLFPANQPRVGVQGAVIVGQGPGWVAVAADLAYGQAVLSSVRPVLDSQPLPLDFSIDHDQVVLKTIDLEAVLGVVRNLDQLEAYLVQLDRIRRAIGAADLSAWSGPTPPPRMGIYQRPGWEYRTRDDAMLSRVQHTGGGQNHQAHDVVMCQVGPLPFVTLRHTWETTRTVTTTNSDGTTSTRTETDHHEEQLCEFHPRFAFPPIKVNGGLGLGDKVTFEWHDFNERFSIRCRDARFAHDVIHPRQMEYLMAYPAPPFTVHRHGAVTVVLRQYDSDSLLWAQRFLEGFFGRVPNFVWENLGYQEPPLPLLKGQSGDVAGGSTRAQLT